MFDRGRNDNGAGDGTSGTSVALSLADGTELKGRIAIQQGRAIADVLNGPGPFIEFEAFDGPRQFLAKHAINGVRLIVPPRAPSLARMRDAEGFDPHAILGLPLGAPPEDVRAAYLSKAKVYHPDRYANAELPDDVRAHLEGMARRINAAFAALQAPREESLRKPVQQITPIYSSGAR
jgi:hypothetical protein